MEKYKYLYTCDSECLARFHLCCTSFLHSLILPLGLSPAFWLVPPHVVHFYHLHALDWVNPINALKADPKATSELPPVMAASLRMKSYT